MQRVLKDSKRGVGHHLVPPLSLKSPAVSGRVARHLVAWLVVGVALLVLEDSVGLPRQVVAWVALLVFFGGLISLSRCATTGFWSPASLFLVVIGMFHVGLSVHVILGIDPRLSRVSDYIWFESWIGTRSLYLTALGAVVYINSALLILVFEKPESAPLENDAAIAAHVSSIGAGILLCATLSWFSISVMQVGVSGLFGSYQSFLSATAETRLYLTYPLMGIGLALALISRPRFLGVVGLSLFGVFSIIGFFVGLRGEVLIPMAVAASVVAVRRKMPPFMLVSIGSLLLLMLVNAGKQIRQAGLATSQFRWDEVSPMAALSELGSTLRVVATVVGWHEDGGEPYRYGDTYTGWVVRFVERFTVGAGRPPATGDYRLFNVEIADRAGNIGGSVIGEAYHNFSILGIVLVLGVLGAIFARFSKGHKSAWDLAVYAVIAMPLFNHVRNSFAPVVVSIAAGLALVLIMKLTAPVAEGRLERRLSELS